MRMNELSRVSGVSVPTVKYYLREGLLPPGTPTTARNQADYGEAHLHRLRLIRVLTHLGGLSVASTRGVLAAIDDPAVPVYDMLSVVQRAISPPDGEAPAPDVVAAREDLDRYLAKRRWRVPDDAPARLALADALASLRRLGRDVDADIFDGYADMADELARREVSTIPRSADRADTVEAMVVGTVVFEAAFVALRRLAHANHSARRFPRRPSRSRRPANRDRSPSHTEADRPRSGNGRG